MFPPDNISGLVSTVSMDPSLLRCIFADSKTFEVRYGGKADLERHIVGPWFEIPTLNRDGRATFNSLCRSWIEDENNLTIEGWEGFLAISVSKDGAWKLYFDHNDDGCGLPRGTRGVEISLRFGLRIKK
jgi:hypothetical protein